MTKLKQSSRRFWIVLVAIAVAIFGFDVITFAILEPPLRVAKLETFTHPFATKLRADDAYLAMFPLGTDQEAVLEALKSGGFDGFSKGTPVKGKPGTESYSGMANLSAGLIGSIFVLWYEVQITAEFKENRLSALRAYIFKSSI